jgi:tRNA(fMet)-specific endonuclease VapC
VSLYILDTDIWTLWRFNHPTVRQRVGAAQAVHQVTLAVITVEEQLSGWYARLRQAKQRDEKARAYLQLTESVMGFSGWQVLPFPEPAILRYEQLQGMKLNIRKKDLCIAAITLEHGGTLVSRNLLDFQRVPGLKVEGWTV